jgi:hypothetical protein
MPAMKWLPQASAQAVILSLLATTAWAQTGPTLRELTHARGFAMGGAHRALGLGGESVDGNPATVAMYPRYLLELSGAYDPATKFGFGNVTIMDSVTTSVTAGVSYQFVSMGLDELRSIAHYTTLALAIPISDRLLVGISARYLNLSGLYNANGITMNAGVVFRATDALTVGVSGENLVDINTPLVRRGASLSFGYSGGAISLGADVRSEFLPEVSGPLFTYSFGGEYLAGMTFPLRLGYSYDNFTSSQFVSGGLGYVSEGSGLDLSYRHEIGGSQGRLFVATVKIQIQ